jgi:hypothetical protein
MSKITIKRKWNWISMARKLNVYIDGQNVGMIANNSTETYETSEGKKEVYVDMKGGKSEVLKVDVKSGEDVHLIVYPSSFDVIAAICVVPIIAVSGFLDVFLETGFLTYVVGLVAIAIYFIIRQVMNIKAFVVEMGE